MPSETQTTTEKRTLSTTQQYAKAGATLTLVLITTLVVDLILFAVIGLNIHWLMITIGIIEIISFFGLIFCSFMMVLTDVTRNNSPLLTKLSS